MAQPALLVSKLRENAVIPSRIAKLLLGRIESHLDVVVTQVQWTNRSFHGLVYTGMDAIQAGHVVITQPFTSHETNSEYHHSLVPPVDAMEAGGSAVVTHRCIARQRGRDCA